MSCDILICFGTRPSFIKLWPVYKGLCADGLEPYVLATGQHEELVTQHTAILDMPIHQSLGIMKDSTGLNRTLALVLDRVNDVLGELQPRLVIVHGDTTSGLGAAIAAFHRGIPVAHVEAGLRSHNAWSPYPEEMNRITIDALASLLFAPTHLAADQARQTNDTAKIEMTGNPVVDSVQAVLQAIDEGRILRQHPSLKRYLVLDLHRRESFGPQMAEMAAAVVVAAREHEVKVYWPVHPNPAVQRAATFYESTFADTLVCIPPLNYADFLVTMREALLIVTDSGGVVEEACGLTPTLQLRDYTDRPEAIQSQMSWLVGRDPAQIAKLTGEALAIADTWKKSMVGRANPYGAGHAGEKIARCVKEWIAAR